MVILAAVLLTAASAIYTARNFAITTDISQLIAPDLDWRQRETAFETAFPQRNETILVVVQAPTPELARQATDRLAEALAKRTDVIVSVRRLGGGSFFENNGLLFLPTEEVARSTQRLVEAEPLIGTLAGDPSLRGVMEGIGLALQGIAVGRLKLDDAVRPMNLLSETVENVLAKRPASFSWRVLMSGKPPAPRELRGFLEIKPVLDFSDLEPGRAASTAIRQTATELNLADELAASVRLTGRIPLADEEFATVKDGALLNTSLTILAVLIILWLALRSGRIIVAVFLSLMVGLAITAALGLLMVGAFNLISVAFAVLFIGLGVDFGIQYSVRYRAERHERDELRARTPRHRPINRGAADACRGRDSRRVSVIPAHHLSRRVGTRIDRRHRHGDRLPGQHHSPARAAGDVQPARRTRTSGVCGAGARGPVPRASSGADPSRRRHHRPCWAAAAVLT